MKKTTICKPRTHAIMLRQPDHNAGRAVRAGGLPSDQRTRPMIISCHAVVVLFLNEIDGNLTAAQER